MGNSHNYLHLSMPRHFEQRRMRPFCSSAWATNDAERRGPEYPSVFLLASLWGTALATDAVTLAATDEVTSEVTLWTAPVA